MLGLGASLSTSGGVSEWLPTEESRLVAWYQKATGISTSLGKVSEWQDQSENDNHALQGTSGNMPAYTDGVLTFVSSNSTHLSMSEQITLSEAFTIGIKLNHTSGTGTFLADLTVGSELFKFTAANKMRIKIDDGGSVETGDFTLDSGNFGDCWIVITRNIDDRVSIHYKGTNATDGLQVDNEDVGGPCDIDGIGLRSGTGVGTNGFDGTIEEIQIYSTTSDTLTANINNYLSNL